VKACGKERPQIGVCGGLRSLDKILMEEESEELQK